MNTPIDIKKKSFENVHVFEFIGELDETNADKTFTAIYTAIGDFSNINIVFNMAGLKYLNSKSIGYIADIFSNIEESDGRMFITNLTEEVRDTLELVGITTIIETKNSENEALMELGINQ